MNITSNRYGKGRVRVLRVVRSEDGTQTVFEIEASVALEGDFQGTYLTGDNSQVVPTDTIKNTVQVLAHDRLTGVLEHFALDLCEHFLGKYGQISSAQVELTSKNWRRFQNPDGSAHPHTFMLDPSYKGFTRVYYKRDTAPTVESGVKDLLVLKSTASAFKGYPKCDFTTLPETDDRIMATSMDATWTFPSMESNFNDTNAAALMALLNTFASEFSPSLQNTLFLMATAALESCPELESVYLAMPNKHYLPVNFQPFGMENDNTIFLPTDEPHGQIEAMVTRDQPPV